MKSKSEKKNFQYTLGLDVGIASVGWALLSQNHIIDLGVRAFDKAETADKGESLNLTRRTARLLRRRLRRRAGRLGRLAGILLQHGLISDTNFFKDNKHSEISPWVLRQQGLDRALTNEEWAKVIYHICKHRGFHWVSRADRLKEGSNGDEGGKVKEGLAGTARLMEEKGYRTAAEMVVTEFPEAQRNKQGDYSKSLSRSLLAKELALLFEQQRGFGHAFADSQLETVILGTGDQKTGILWEQKPPLTGQNLLKMLGHCTFEKDEYRAPKASFSAERHVWLTLLNNLRIIDQGEVRPLRQNERQLLLTLPYVRKSRITYKNIRSVLEKAKLIDSSVRFSGLTYGDSKNPEGNGVIELKGWHGIRKVLEDHGLGDEWQAISESALETGTSTLLDDIAWILSVYKEDGEAQEMLQNLALPNKHKVIEALLYLRFDAFSNLSLKALRKIVPLMEQGLRYDEACEKAGYHHSLVRAKKKQTKLPSFYIGRDPDSKTMLWTQEMDIPRNPVVLRAINQTRKVVNAIIDEYGPPSAVHIEMARDLSRPKKERDKIRKAQEQYRDLNQSLRDQFSKEFGRIPSGREQEKWLLYKEQQGKCAYSLKDLDIRRLLDDANYAQVDHVLPFSRSFDDSKNNKVLVLTAENQQKGNRTPYEFLDGDNDSAQWQAFVAFVHGNKAFRQAKRNRLLRKHFGAEDSKGFRDRNLNDTRYICRFLKNYIEQYLQLAPENSSERVVVVNGQLTAFLRARWGLTKVRDESDRHHALDALVVAACSHSMVKRLSDYSRRRELQYARTGFIDYESGEVQSPEALEKLEKHFPLPWPHFREEAISRLFTDDLKKLKSEISAWNTYSDAELERIRPLFVSRAPQRRNSGAAHKETIYSQPKHLESEESVTQKIPLSTLKLSDLAQLIDPHRNEKLYQAIEQQLRAHGGKPEKAFPVGHNFRKPDKDGNPTGPIVRSVTKLINKQTGIPVRGGLAKNDTMLRVDVFQKAGKYFLVPVYVHHRVKGLPNKAIVAHKNEEEWQTIDDTFDFLFCLYPNDFVEIKLKNRIIRGYYAGTHRGTSGIALLVHDRNQFVGKAGRIEGIGVRSAISLTKYNVDVLGRTFLAKPEDRLQA